MKQIDFIEFRARINEATRVMQRAFAVLQQRLRESHERIRARRSPELIDRLSEARYRAAVAHERRVGMRYVEDKAAAVRRELGLDG